MFRLDGKCVYLWGNVRGRRSRVWRRRVVPITIVTYDGAKELVYAQDSPVRVWRARRERIRQSCFRARLQIW